MDSNIQSPEFYASLSPNIRKLVRLLHEWGYGTSDSGDGSNASKGMECAVPYPMVVIQLNDSGIPLEREADLLWDRLSDEAHVPMGEDSETGLRKVEASYECGGFRLLLVLNVTDADLQRVPAPE